MFLSWVGDDIIWYKLDVLDLEGKIRKVFYLRGMIHNFKLASQPLD